MLDIEKLQRSWWSTPLAMSGWMLLLTVPFAGPLAIPVVLAITLAGLLWGWRSSARAKADVGKAFNVSYLASDHQLSQRVSHLAAKLGLPAPAVGVMQTPNALAVGTNPKESAVVLGLPLMTMLNEDEMDAVIGHELGHIATKDVHRMQVAEGYQRLLNAIVSFYVFILVVALAKRQSKQLAAIFGELARITLFFGSDLAVKRLSRKREFYADAIGAALTSPDAMAGALTKLHGQTGNSQNGNYAHLMFWGTQRTLRWFSTHPTLEQRIQASKDGSYQRQLQLSNHR